MECFPGEAEAKKRLLERHGIDVEKSYRMMMWEIAGSKTPEIIAASQQADRLPLDPAMVARERMERKRHREWQKQEARRLRELGYPHDKIAALIGASEISAWNWTR